MLHLIALFITDRRGATAIEYALIGALISAAIVAGAMALGTALNTMYVGVDSKVGGAVN